MVIIDWFPKGLFSINFYIHEIISLWFKSKTNDSEFHILPTEDNSL